MSHHSALSHRAPLSHHAHTKGHVKINIEKATSFDDDESIPKEILPKQSELSKEDRKLKFRSLHSCHDLPHVKRPADLDNANLQKILDNNIQWAKQTSVNSPQFFQHLSEGQHPEYLWIGCSDSRVPAEQVIGFKPGELFVHRNVANQAPLSDINAMAVIQYAVQNLKVKDIIVCGHYGCGGIKAALKKQDYGALQTWLSYIRNLKLRYRKELTSENQVDNQNLLVQLNVRQNVFNIARSAVVQRAWKEGRKLRIHGLVYHLQTGLLNNLEITINSLDDIPEQSRFY